jgi:hypothetical protein
MKTLAITAAKADFKRAPMPLCMLLATVGVIAAILVTPVTAKAAGDSAPAGKSGPVSFELIPGSSVKRVILTAKAAERLGIEVGKVSEETVTRRQMVSGLVTAAVDMQPGDKPGGGFGGFGQTQATPATPVATGGTAKPVGMEKVATVAVTQVAVLQKTGAGVAGGLGKPIAAAAIAAAGVAPSAAAAPPVDVNAPMRTDAWVLVNLSAGEWERLAKDKPARLVALDTRDKLGSPVLAQPSGMAPIEDPKRSMLAVYYMVPGKDHGLVRNSRMRVELQVVGNEEKLKVVPYSAVYYDGKGAAWVYVNSKPLTYERQRIGVDRVVGDLAVLSDGPAVGTSIVTVGASMLFGAEIFGK